MVREGLFKAACACGVTSLGHVGEARASDLKIHAHKPSQEFA
jgi:hypothetical protein